MEEVSNFCPPMAVPMTVKIPDPITAPIPRAVSETGPRVFFSRRSGSSESEISLSIDLQQKSWFSEVRGLPSVVRFVVIGVCAKRRCLLECSTEQLRRHSALKPPGQAPTAKRFTASPRRAPSSSLCASSSRERIPVASAAFLLSLSCGRCVLLSCVLLWLVSSYLP